MNTTRQQCKRSLREAVLMVRLVNRTRDATKSDKIRAAPFAFDLSNTKILSPSPIIRHVRTSFIDPVSWNGYTVTKSVPCAANCIWLSRTRDAALLLACTGRKDCFLCAGRDETMSMGSQHHGRPCFTMCHALLVSKRPVHRPLDEIEACCTAADAARGRLCTSSDFGLVIFLLVDIGTIVV